MVTQPLLESRWCAGKSAGHPVVGIYIILWVFFSVK